MAAYQPEDFYNRVSLGLVELAAAGITTVNNWAHNVRGPEMTFAIERTAGLRPLGSGPDDLGESGRARDARRPRPRLPALPQPPRDGRARPMSLSFDATSIAPVDMFQSMNIAWNIGIPLIGTATETTSAGSGQTRAPGRPQQAPACDIESAIVHAATPANVDTVLVDGRILKRDKQLKGFDVPELVRNAAASAHAIRNRAGGRLTPASSTVLKF